MCEPCSPHIPLVADTIYCSRVAERILKRTEVSQTVDKIVDLITTMLIVRFLIVIFFLRKKLGGERTTI
jgi:hypothetical protein